MNKEWDVLTFSQHKELLDEAHRLIDGGYVQDCTVEELAKRMHNTRKQNQKVDGEL